MSERNNDRVPDLGRRALLLLGSLAPLLVSMAVSGEEPATERLPTGNADDFEFLIGHWRVQHETLGRDGTWSTNRGECSTQKLLGGPANVEDHVWGPTGDQRAIAIRAFDPTRRVWSVWWLDRRWPGAMGTPMTGGFRGASGQFFGTEESNGREVRVRFDWFVDRPDLCRWEQAYSSDDGASWQTNWKMRFERSADVAALEPR